MSSGIWDMGIWDGILKFRDGSFRWTRAFFFRFWEKQYRIRSTIGVFVIQILIYLHLYKFQYIFSFGERSEMEELWD
jgi:hypothetical protein